MADLDRRLVFSEYRDLASDSPFDRLCLADRFAELDDQLRPLSSGAFAFDVLLVEPGDDETPTRFQILRLRDYDNRPYVYAPGQTPVPVNIRSHESIIDVAHVVMWPDGYVAIDQGGHAPPLSALQRFLPTRCGQYVRFVPLYDRQVVERLKAIRKGVRRVEIGVENASKTQQELDKQLPPLRGLFGLVRGNEGITFKSEIKVDRRGRGARSRVLPEHVSEQLLLDAEEAQSYLDTYRVSGITSTGKRDTVDLISEKLHVPKKIPRAAAGGHMPDSDAAFDAIFSARKELDRRGALDAAARGTLSDESG